MRIWAIPRRRSITLPALGGLIRATPPSMHTGTESHLAHLLSGSYGPAKEAIDRALLDWPNSPPSLRAKAAICGLLGDVEEGRECVQRILASNPDTTLVTVKALNRPQTRSNSLGYKNFYNGLRRAGLPEGTA